MKQICVAAAIALAMAASAAFSARAGQPSPDQRELEKLEQQWLEGEHDRTTLERVLGDDFVHPVPAGVFLSKGEHIDWAVQHPAPPGQRQRFDRLRVRIYGDVGIATGIVITRGAGGREDRSIFTDVFARRVGRWQAINAQENEVR